MLPVIAFIAIPATLAGLAAIAFAVIVAGIRQGDRVPLTSNPVGRADAIARRYVRRDRYPEESSVLAQFEGPVSS